MSVRASLFRQVLRITGRMLTASTDPVQLRNKVESMVERLPAKPDDIKFTAFNIEHIPAYWYEPEDRIPGAVLFYLHGGGYMICSAQSSHRDLICRLARASQQAAKYQAAAG